MKTALLLVDHGSARAKANELLAEVALLVRALSGLEVVECAHMELAEPTIAQALEACERAGADLVIVHPYFLAPGNHSTQDIPRLVGEAAARHPRLRYRVTEPLGLHAKIAEVVLERAGLPSVRDQPKVTPTARGTAGEPRL